MDKMPGLLQWLLLVLYFIRHPAWTLSVDIMLNGISRCESVQPVVCKQDFNGLTWSVRIIPNDLFTLGRSVRSLDGDIVLLSSLCNGGHAEHSVKHVFDVCSINCSTFFSMQGHIYLQSVHSVMKTERESVFDTVKPNNRQLDSIIKGISSLLSRDKWNTIILFASSYEAATTIPSKTLSPIAKMFLFTMDNSSHLNDILDRLYMQLEKEDLNFIVVCSVTCIVDFLSQVYHFETMVGKISNKWLVIPTAGLLGNIINSSMQVPDADIVLIDQAPNKQEYPLLRPPLTSPSVSPIVYILYTLQKEKKIRRVGHITHGGDVIVSEDLFPGFKYGLKDQTLTISTLEWPPFVFKKEENGSITYSGVCIDILQELSRGLNFSYHIVEPEDQEWGRELDGRWTGLVGQLAYKKADLVVAPLAVMETREHVMDFTVPYFHFQSAIIIKKPEANANKWMTLIAPFRYEVQICILVSLIFSTVCLFVVEEIHPVNTWTDNRLSARWTRYGNILWYHVGAMMANGASYRPTTLSGRSVLTCWWLFTVISAAVYSGNLIAFLTDWREKPPFTTLEEMVEQDTFKWGTLGGTAVISLFKDSNLSVYKKLWHGMQRESEHTSFDMEIHVSKVLEGQYAYLGDEAIMESWKLKQCDLQVLHDPFYLWNYAIGLPNNSPLTSIFSDQVLRIKELGLPRVWYKQLSSNVLCETSRSAKRVDLLALQSVFYAAGVGLFLSLSALMAEVIHIRKCRKHELSNQENNKSEITT